MSVTDGSRSGSEDDHTKAGTRAHSLDNEKMHKASDSNSEPVKQSGVLRAEAFARLVRAPGGKKVFWGIAIAVFACQWVYSMQGSTTWSYAVWATSDFQQHSSGLASLNIATEVIAAVCVPFLAKFSDVFARSWTYFFCIIAYTVGFIMIAFAPTIACYIVGSVLTSIGGAAIALLNSVFCADLIPLKWRGLSLGILGAPYLATVWYTSEIASALSTNNNWRWGYGMYAIIMPVVMGPALVALIHFESKAKKQGIEISAAGPSIAPRNAGKESDAEKSDVAVTQEPPKKVNFKAKLVRVFEEMDTIGLLLLGFGWTLILLPFSLSVNANDGYRNPSLIAMFVVGGICLIAYIFYEAYWAKFPTAPIRLLKNRTFITAVILNFNYMMAGYMNLTYISSYVYIVTDLDARHWNYWNNTLTMGLCGFGVVAGLVQRYTHRYKFIQICGLIIKIIGYGLLVDKNGVRDLGRLTMSQVLAGAGGAFSVVASQVSSQGSVPHQDVALVIALLSLWTAIGGAIGTAIASGVWTSSMPGNLRRFIPLSTSDEDIALFFADITTIKALPFDSEVRQGAIRAYETTVYPLWAGALGLSFVSLIAGLFQTNYYLGDQQNAYDNKDITGETLHVEHEVKPKTKWQRMARFWDL